ncbi:NAD(P)H-hydrate dehydratase [Ruegeria sediminis]|uniref:Bifunctional NAD(P)H-hydrate repair enzyme n=1 Tax=Ruegeria sediminis TaxID=2583820 RepID=A0ABY2WVU2_9RHOB|nr:NAD(P)H-hydrate dehydratase [Ruegeria sediminis]TMV06391.1 NAD(P)H-hydrate dehydratase [Ruegeria sediminis]
MTELLTAAQMRAIELAAIESGEVTGLELMERAGQGVVEAIFEEWPDLGERPQRAVVLCGPGNNGGDGFVVARLLKERGWDVDVFLYGDPEKLPPDARANFQRWLQLGEVQDLADAPEPSEDADLYVDALFGTGLTRALTDVVRDRVVRFNTAPAVARKTVAVDIPSGLCSDSGRVLGDGACAPRAGLTVTFHARKLGHVLGAGPMFCGKVAVADIGLRAGSMDEVATLTGKPDPDAGLVKPGAGQKYVHGHALVLSGGPGKTGAARLAARGALRIGAGLVTLGVPPEAQMEVAGHITALMLRRVDGAEGLAETLVDERLNALCLGPGLGLERARELVPVVLGQGEVKPRPTVLDADALTAFADRPDELFGLLHDTCVLTPHGGEFARLFPDLAERLKEVPTKGPAYSKVDATREAAKRAGCIVLFKGADTVIAAPNGRCSVNSAHYERAAPWLATAGSGDVLAGFVTGLLARGFAPMAAAETAAWLHVECARSFGPGLIAEDLPEQLPAVFRDMGL